MPTADHTGRVPSPSVIRALVPVVFTVVGLGLIVATFTVAAKDRDAYDERRATEVAALEEHYDVTITERPDFNFLGAWVIDGTARSCSIVYPEGTDPRDGAEDPSDLRLSCLPDEELVDLADLNDHPRNLP